MEAQLDFAWQHENVIWKPNISVPIERQQKLEMPEQLHFKLADLPAIPADLPAPLAFTNKPTKKLIQFSGLPSKAAPKAKKKAEAKPKPATVKKVAKIIEPKPEWNSKVGTTGLFDVDISKKIPIELKHAIKKESSTKPKKPEVFSDFSEIPVKGKAAAQKKTSEKLIDDNLEIKFIADQEEIVKNLEKQLESEKAARKRLDEQFAEKLKEMERMNSKVKVAQESIKVYETREVKPEPVVNRAVTAIDQGDRRILEIRRPGSSEKVRFEARGGDVYEPPTHDLAPMVLKAGKAPAISKLVKPTQISKPSVPITAVPRPAASFPPAPRTQSLQFIDPKPFAPPAPKPVANFTATDIVSSDPMLASLNSLLKVKSADRHPPTSDIVLKIGSKYIAYYANELSELLIEDFLEDCVYELQIIEQRKKQRVHQEFKKDAEDHFEQIVKDFQEEADKVQRKYLEKPKKNLKLVEECIGEEILIEDYRREWEVSLGGEVLEKIRKYKKAFEDFQKIFAGGSEGRLWDVYGVIGDDLINEIIGDVAEEYDNMLDEFTERMVAHEFA